MTETQYLDLTPTRVDLTLVRGDTWKLSFTFPEDETEGSPGIDLSGSEWLVQVREETQDGDIFATFVVDTSTQDEGTILMSVDESITQNATVGKRVYWYDVQQSKDNDVATPIMGRITIIADTSKD